MNKSTQQQLIMYATFLIMVGLNILANVLPFNGYTTREISDLHHVLITPAGYTFMIWGVIYAGLLLWLIGFTIKKQTLTKKIVSTFIISCGLNIAWLLAWHYLFNGTAVIIMGLYFISVFVLYLFQRHQHEHKWLQIPISLYFGWLTIACIVNIMYYLVAVAEISFVSQLSYSYLALCIIIILGLTILFFWKDKIILIVFIWALLGIIIKNSQTNISLSIVTTIFTLFLIGAMIFLIRQKKHE